MAENTNLTLTVEAWADIVIKEWEKKIELLGIGVSWQLVDSFAQHVWVNANGDPSRVEFVFNYYGRFVDYGVGNHVPLYDRDAMIASGETKRRPKPWYSDTFFKQLEVLRHLIGEKTARNVEQMIVINGSDVNSTIAPTSSKQSSNYAANKNRR